MYTFIDKSSNAEHSVGTTADALAGECTVYHDNSPHMTNSTCLHTSAKDHNNLTLFFYYYGQRLYSANLSRWISRDPIGETGAENLYCFTFNEPAGDFDPLGEFTSGTHQPSDFSPEPGTYSENYNLKGENLSLIHI